MPKTTSDCRKANRLKQAVEPSKLISRVYLTSAHAIKEVCIIFGGFDFIKQEFHRF